MTQYQSNLVETNTEFRTNGFIRRCTCKGIHDATSSFHFLNKVEGVRHNLPPPPLHVRPPNVHKYKVKWLTEKAASSLTIVLMSMDLMRHGDVATCITSQGNNQAMSGR